MEKVFKFGKMEQNMMETGKMEKPMEREHFFTLMVTFMKVSSEKIEQMDKEPTIIKTVRNTLDPGKMT